MDLATLLRGQLEQLGAAPLAPRRSRFSRGGACELLNRCSAATVRALAVQLGLVGDEVGALRLAVWRALERSAGEAAPAPMLIGGRLVPYAPPLGLSPPAAAWPRPLPPARTAEPPADEPECLDTLLDAADRALGVRLGPRGRAGKGVWGQRAAALLGVPERGELEPDWRGDVELKTVAVARSREGQWRVVEDPAISALGSAPLAKLQRVLWLCRAEVPPDDATLVSWYLLEWSSAIAAMVARCLHTRPKGPRGSHGRGYYLHKGFFAECGLLSALNGPPPGAPGDAA